MRVERRETITNKRGERERHKRKYIYIYIYNEI